MNKLLRIIIFLIIIGVMLFLVESLIPIDYVIRRCIEVVIVIFVIILLLRELPGNLEK